jgi:polysaccharide biosynthesis transport protein
MNSPHPPNANSHPPSGLKLDDIVFILFRHKVLVLFSLALALVSALAVRFVRPPLYVSKAKVMLHYILDAPRGPITGTAQEQAARTLDATSAAIFASEIEILTSLDVAQQAADLVGPEKILAKKGGGTNRIAAAGVVSSGIEVDPPRSAILTISFKHPDVDVVQPVLDALIKSYQHKHAEIHAGGPEVDALLASKRDEAQLQLRKAEEELRRLKTLGQVLQIEDTKHLLQAQISRNQDELLDAERQLAEHRAILRTMGGGVAPRMTNSETWVPPEKVKEYNFLSSEYDTLKNHERELLVTFKEMHPFVVSVRGRMERISKDKTELERSFPVLAALALGSGRSGTNSVGSGSTDELIEVTRLEARMSALSSIRSNLLGQATQLTELEPQIAEAQRRRDDGAAAYNSVVMTIEQRLIGSASMTGRGINMSIVQTPTPPGRDIKKLLKFVAVTFFGLLGAGLGFSFLIELFFDRTIKRAADVERHLKMPVFLTIPDTNWKDRLAPRWLGGWWRKKLPVNSGANANGDGVNQTALAAWDPAHFLHVHAEGLRERLMTYFEINNLNLKKPKLVAVTGCSAGSGVSTLASCLAATLSKTGDGNVLLVDMNGDQGLAHSFYQGKPGCGLTQVLEEPGARASALVQENLYVARLEEEGKNDKLATVLPRRFNHIVPKLKASDYDYIIFDMPPVSPTSATARLASHMDIALLVLEAEKTNQHSAERAASLMRESRANVAAVLNKHRSHVPSALASEA